MDNTIPEIDDIREVLRSPGVNIALVARESKITRPQVYSMMNGADMSYTRVKRIIDTLERLGFRVIEK